MKRKIIIIGVGIIFLASIFTFFIFWPKNKIEKEAQVIQNSGQSVVSENTAGNLETIQNQGENLLEKVAVEEEKKKDIWTDCAQSEGARINKDQSSELKRKLKPDDDAIRLAPHSLIIKNDGRMFFGEKDLSKSDKQIFFEGDLTLNSKYLRYLPKKLFIGGYFNFHKINSKMELPDSVKASGSAGFFGEFEKLPEELIVGDVLNISDTKITKIPDGFMVGGNLDARNILFSQNFSQNFYIGKNFNLTGSTLDTLPINADFYSDLNLTKTAINFLPCGLNVKNNLIISGTVIEFLPENLKVGNVLDARDTPLAKILRGDNSFVSDIKEKIGAKEIYY